MHITRRKLFLASFAVGLTPILPTINAQAAPKIATVTFANDPVRRAALDHMMAVVIRAAENIEFWRKKSVAVKQDCLCGMDQLSKYCYMENGADWDDVQIENPQALEQAVLRKIEEVAADVRTRRNGKLKKLSDFSSSQNRILIEHLGFGSFPISIRVDSNQKTATALENLILPIL